MKKNFCDGWDNLLAVFLYNAICVCLCVGAFFFMNQLIDIPVVPIVVLLLFTALIVSILFAVNITAAKFADFKYVSFKETFSEIPNVWKDALLFSCIVLGLFYLARVGIPFYARMNTLFGLFLASVVFWVLVVTVLSLQWFFPIRAQLGDNFLKALKKSFIVFFDNAGLSVFLFVYTILMLIMSFFTAFLVPGFSGILLAYNNAFRILLYKYDWLEDHPDIPIKQARKQIPWDELLADDRETLGPRSLKSFIFPWKD